MKTAEVQIPPGNIELCLLITSPYITCLTCLGRHHRKAISVRNEGGRRCYFPSLTQTSIMSPYPPQLTIPTETSIPDWCPSYLHPSPNTQIIPQPLQGPSIRQRWRILHINPSLVCFCLAVFVFVMYVCAIHSFIYQCSLEHCCVRKAQ